MCNVDICMVFLLVHFFPDYKEKKYKGSSLIYELGMLIVGFLLLPIGIIHGFLRGLIGLPNERFDKSTTDE